MPDPADFPAGAQFIEVPGGDLITLSTTQLPALSLLGLLDQARGGRQRLLHQHSRSDGQIAAGEISEVGFGAEINIERVLELAPDLVMSYGFNPATDAHPVLLEAGIFTALDASWRELSPLGRAEWLKFTALFYNREAEAEAIYDEIAADYAAVQAAAAAVMTDERPAVLLNTFSGLLRRLVHPGRGDIRRAADAGCRRRCAAGGSRLRRQPAPEF